MVKTKRINYKNSVSQFNITEITPNVSVSEKPTPVKKQPVVVVFQDPLAKRKEDVGAKKRKKAGGEEEQGGLDMKAAQHEIFMFGIKGMDRESRLQARDKLAMRLGAKPRKKGFKNYKEVIEERKKAIIEEREQRIENHKMKIKTKKPLTAYEQKKLKEKNKRDIFTTGYGKFSNGRLILNKETRKELRLLGK